MSLPASIGRYEIQHLLGRGARSLIYLARDPVLQRLVAIKTMLPRAEDPRATRERFRREAENSAFLNHPGIVTVFDEGEDEAVGPFMAMEYVNGPTLAEKLREGLAPEAALQLLFQGVDVLQAAAEAGIVHRDVQPGNILVGPENRFKLMDFGRACRSGAESTRAGDLIGTPGYTAPELLLGAVATPATDAYAFTVLAHELLTGALPYAGANPGELLHRIVHDPPRLPPGLDPCLAEVFLRAFEKDPAGRFPDLPSFLEALVRAAPVPVEVRDRFLSLFEEDPGPAGTQGFLPALILARQAPTAEVGTLPLPRRTPEGASTPSANLTRPLSGDNRATTPQRAFRPPAADVPPRTPAFPRRLGGILGLASILLVLLVVAGTAGRRARPRRMDLRSSPSGAEVALDGRRLGLTPLTAVDLPAKGGLLRFSREGSLPVEIPVPASGDVVDVSLRPRPDTLRVVTDPPGAQIVLNGTWVGTTPKSALPVPATGTVELRLRLEGYLEWQGRMDQDIEFPEVIRLSPERKKGRPGSEKKN